MGGGGVGLMLNFSKVFWVSLLDFVWFVLCIFIIVGSWNIFIFCSVVEFFIDDDLCIIKVFGGVSNGCI